MLVCCEVFEKPLTARSIEPQQQQQQRQQQQVQQCQCTALLIRVAAASLEFRAGSAATNIQLKVNKRAPSDLLLSSIFL